MDDSSEIAVTLVYASHDRQVSHALQLPAGSTIADAVSESGIALAFPEVDFKSAAKGIYGEKAPDDRVLQDGDRVEIYRPLAIDPKEARRQRAQRV